MVRQWQELFYKNNLSAVRMHQPDFVKLAEAYGMRGLRVTDRAQVQSGIDAALSHDGPVVIDFQVDEHENTYPMVPSPALRCRRPVDSPYQEPAADGRAGARQLSEVR